jgi:hypothetical protein
MKKGFEIQFTWIFVIIAGAILFAFLMMVVNKQKEGADKRADAGAKAEIANILTTAGANSGAFNPHDIPSTTITFTCDEPATSSFRVGKSGASQSLATSIVFSQTELKGNQLYSWTQDWELPYRAATFVYLTNKRTRYIFYTPTDESRAFYQKMFKDFPEGFVQEKIDSKTDLLALQSKGYDANVIVQIKKGGAPADYIGEDAIIHQTSGPANIATNGFKKESEKIHLVIIEPETGATNGGVANDNFGKITFYKRLGLDKEKGTSFYYGRQMLFGAVFAPQKDMYSCTIQKAFDRAQLVSALNYKRVNDLDASATSGLMSTTRPHCQYLYGYIAGTFDNQSYPFCGNVRIFLFIVEKIKAGQDPQIETTQNAFSGCTGPLCFVGNGGCKDNTFQRLEDNYNRLVREANDISLEGNCPYVY